MRSILRDHRCEHCKRLLFRGLLLSGSLEIRCARCKTENVIRGISGSASKESQYFIVFDYDGKIVDASTSAMSILGYSREELLGLDRADLRSDINPADYVVLRKKILDGVGSPAFDTVHRKKNGDFIPVKLRVKVLPSEGNRFALIIGKVLSDDHDLAAVGQSKRYELSLNNKDQIVYVSNPMAILLGYRWISLIGTEITKLISHDEGLTLPTTLNDLLKRERFFAVEKVWMKRQDGTIVECGLGFYPHDDDYEGFVGYDVVGTVTEHA